MGSEPEVIVKQGIPAKVSCEVEPGTVSGIGMIRIAGRSVGGWTTHQSVYHDEDEDLDPRSTPSMTASSQSESDSEAEYIVERSSRGRSRSGQPDQPGKSATALVPTTQLELTEGAQRGQLAPQAEQSGSAGLTSGSAGPTSEQQDLISFDSDVIVEEEQETIIESEVVSSEERGVSPSLQELSQRNAMAASAVPIGDDEADSDGMFTRDELKEAQRKDDGIWISIEYCKKGSRRIVQKLERFQKRQKNCFCNSCRCYFATTFCRRFQHPDGTTNYLQLILPIPSASIPISDTLDRRRLVTP